MYSVPSVHAKCFTSALSARLENSSGGRHCNPHFTSTNAGPRPVKDLPQVAGPEFLSLAPHPSLPVTYGPDLGMVGRKVKEGGMPCPLWLFVCGHVTWSAPAHPCC